MFRPGSKWDVIGFCVLCCLVLAIIVEMIVSFWDVLKGLWTSSP
jgi:hypothetical protein